MFSTEMLRNVWFLKSVIPAVLIRLYSNFAEWLFIHLRCATLILFTFDNIFVIFFVVYYVYTIFWVLTLCNL